MQKKNGRTRWKKDPQRTSWAASPLPISRFRLYEKNKPVFH